MLGILAMAFVFANAMAGYWPGMVLLVLIVLAVAYFWDSPRDVPAEPLAVIAPVDGTVVHRRECYDPYLDREAIRITLRVHPFGAYLLRAPVEGTVLELPGEVVERQGGVASMIRTDEGDELVVAIRHGSLLGSHPCRSNYGERVGQGRCCGMRRLARRVDIYLPVNSRVEVELGDSVSAGACALAKLVHKHSNACKLNSERLGAAVHVV